MLPVVVRSSAQSLGEVARQCRKEREALEKRGEVPAKVFTNDDIVRMATPATAESSEQTPATAAGARQPAETAAGKPSVESSAPHPGKANNNTKSREYWRARFKAARIALAHAREKQTLVEDELRLLQIQQARELNAERSRKLNSQIDSKTIELEAKRAATEKAQAALDEARKEFKKSGAPQDWIHGEKSQN